MAGNAKSQSRLLQLPGELRNHIYDFAREESPVGEQTVTRSQPLFRGLTQTCRTIRSEYRPMYMEHTIFSMRLLEAYTFIAAYVVPHGEDSHGTLLINFDYGLTSIETSILPLVKLLRRFAKVSAHATCSDPRLRRDLNVVLSACEKGWFDSISAPVARITVKKETRHTDQTPRIVFNWYMCADTRSPFFLSKDTPPSQLWMWRETCFDWFVRFMRNDMAVYVLEVDFRPVWS
ncbi:hypothetical protein P171DRAFT_476711 [Karstenula rhodostoma CBS 690.94]|uniref:F-box domain-containing protein n=1 Tax=Karstenula rhodostoma CBS 690.94 TaxID=1392251 RepID=A0A9P4P8X3_9PLEO|nr:hypothetical protein P171DRAFT_476711 [Karstenula rhodostoma CBS 690.94]